MNIGTAPMGNRMFRQGEFQKSLPWTNIVMGRIRQNLKSLWLTDRALGYLAFTKSLRKNLLESQWNNTFWIVPAENFRDTEHLQRYCPVFRTECSKRKFVFHL